MSEPRGIIVFGPNGSGKTTLGRELARLLNFKYMDIEEYHFSKSDIPYTAVRQREECLALMEADIDKHGSIVISAVTGDLGDAIFKMYELAIWVTAPLELRLERVERRIREQHEERVGPGGDMHDQHIRFMDFVASRSLSKIEKWAQTLACPVVHIDGTKDWRVSAEEVAKIFMTKTEYLGEG